MQSAASYRLVLLRSTSLKHVSAVLDVSHPINKLKPEDYHTPAAQCCSVPLSLPAPCEAAKALLGKALPRRAAAAHLADDSAVCKAAGPLNPPGDTWGLMGRDEERRADAANGSTTGGLSDTYLQMCWCKLLWHIVCMQLLTVVNCF